MWYSITILVLAIIVAVFITLFIITNKKLKENVKALKDSNDSLAQCFTDYDEIKRELRSYEITVENYENLLVKVSDELPKKHEAKSYAMKLANELAEYFKIDEENNKVSLIVYKGEI